MDDYKVHFYATRGGKPKDIDVGDLSDRRALRERCAAVGVLTQAALQAVQVVPGQRLPRAARARRQGQALRQRQLRRRVPGYAGQRGACCVVVAVHGWRAGVDDEMVCVVSVACVRGCTLLCSKLQVVVGLSP